MFGRQPDRLPLLDVKLPNGVRVTVGPSAVRLLLGALAIGVVAAGLFLAGAPLAATLAIMLRPWAK